MAFLTHNLFQHYCVRPAALAALGCALIGFDSSALADGHCPGPALSVKESPITTVDEQNYSLAETQVIFADYVRKIAAATCSGGVGQLMHLRNTPDPTDKVMGSE